MYKTPTFLLFIFTLSVSTLISAAPQEQKSKTETQEKEAAQSPSLIPHFTEEVEVVAKAPEAVPPVIFAVTFCFGKGNHREGQ